MPVSFVRSEPEGPTSAVCSHDTEKEALFFDLPLSRHGSIVFSKLKWTTVLLT